MNNTEICITNQSLGFFLHHLSHQTLLHLGQHLKSSCESCGKSGQFFWGVNGFLLVTGQNLMMAKPLNNHSYEDANGLQKIHHPKALYQCLNPLVTIQSFLYH